jgi:hypothetical protein
MALAASAVISFLGFVVVIMQLRDSNRQTKLESQIRLYDINRELIAMGFSKPELFEVLKDAKEVDPTTEQHYLQLWLNHLCLVDSFKRSGVFQKDVQESFEADLRDMMTMKNLRRHWRKVAKFYPASFQESINNILHKAGHKSPDEKAEEAMR